MSCPNALPLVATYAVTKPTQQTPNGTIVLFSGAGGTRPSTDTGQEDTFAADYVNLGYTVVEFFWAEDWEDTNNPEGAGPGQGQYAYNVQTAACRPATFLEYAYTTLATNPQTSGFCAQGTSAGSAAVAYSMAWYGAGTVNSTTYPPLDKVELAVGPPLSDLEQGCEEPEPSDQQICTSGQTQNCICPDNGTSQNNWCVGWTNGTALSQAYSAFTAGWISTWTNDGTCQNESGTSQASNQNWYQQSIVETTPTSQGNFSYPNTSMSAWLCDSVLPGDGSLNETTPQGWLFYQAVANAAAPPLNYMMTAVENCTAAEGFEGGMIAQGLPYAGDTGMQAVETDMADPLHTKTAVCPPNPRR